MGSILDRGETPLIEHRATSSRKRRRTVNDGTTLLTRSFRIEALDLALVVVFAAACSGPSGSSSGATGGSGANGGADGSGKGPSANGANGATGATGAGAGSPGGGAALRLPLITPPVRAAAPVGLSGGTTPQALGAPVVFTTTSLALDSSDIKQRFFGAGPTNLFQILGSIDARIAETNMRAAQKAPCLSQTPIAYSLMPFGGSVTFQAQCFDTIGTDAFFQFGEKDGSTYFYSTGGAAHVAARVTPAGDAGDKWAASLPRTG